MKFRRKGVDMEVLVLREELWVFFWGIGEGRGWFGYCFLIGIWVGLIRNCSFEEGWVRYRKSLFSEVVVLYFLCFYCS